MTDPNADTKTVTLVIDRRDAWDLAQLLKRLTWTEIQANAQDRDEAETMRDAIARFQRELAAHGVAPR